MSKENSLNTFSKAPHSLENKKTQAPALVFLSPNSQPASSQPPVKALATLAVPDRRWSHDHCQVNFVNFSTSVLWTFIPRRQMKMGITITETSAAACKSQNSTSWFPICPKEKHRTKWSPHSVPFSMTPKARKHCCFPITVNTDLFRYKLENTPHTSLKCRAPL